MLIIFLGVREMYVNGLVFFFLWMDTMFINFYFFVGILFSILYREGV